MEPFRFVYGTLGFHGTHVGKRWFRASSQTKTFDKIFSFCWIHTATRIRLGNRATLKMGVFLAEVGSSNMHFLPVTAPNKYLRVQWCNFPWSLMTRLLEFCSCTDSKDWLQQKLDNLCLELKGKLYELLHAYLTTRLWCCWKPTGLYNFEWNRVFRRMLPVMIKLSDNISENNFFRADFSCIFLINSCNADQNLKIEANDEYTFVIKNKYMSDEKSS